MTLKNLKNYWEQFLDEPPAFAEQAWLPAVNPASRQFFVACWESLRAVAANLSTVDQELSGWTELIDRIDGIGKTPGLDKYVTPYQIKSAKLHLEYLRLTRGPFTTKTRRAKLEDLAARFERPLGTVLDIECELSETPQTDPSAGPEWATTGSLLCGRLRPSIRRVTIPGLFELLPPAETTKHDSEVPGRVASLTLEWVVREEKSLAKGNGNFYHVPALDFVTQDEPFQEALGVALESLESYGLVLTNADVRYRLALRGTTAEQVLSKLSGPSLCRAFELALLKLFSLAVPEHLRKELASIADIPLGGIAVTAAFAPKTKSDAASVRPSPRLWREVGGSCPNWLRQHERHFPQFIPSWSRRIRALMRRPAERART